MNFFLFQWNLGYHEALSTNSSFTMEFWLSRSLSHELFFFTMEFWLSRSLSDELFFFHDGILSIKEPFSRIFLSRWNSQNVRFGGRLFSYIYISQRVFT
jgi:hypothetical protein